MSTETSGLARRAGAAAPSVPSWAVLALVFNAFTWGVSWWPFRWLQGHGLHPLWATVVIYLVAVAAISAWRPRAWAALARAPTLWWLVLAAGTTNATFNWAVTTGDVVRVVLLFYLMPLWAVLLARVLLGERLTAHAGLRVGLALAGAVVVLWPEDGLGRGLEGLPLPRTLGDALAVIGGFTFALNNVMLRREAHQPAEARALAMFGGGALVAGVLAWQLGLHGAVPWPPAPALPWLAGVGAMALAFLAGNLALQFGAARLPAHTTAVVMLTEVPFAAASALWLGGGTMSWALAIGGALIVGATLLAALARDRR